MEQVSEMILQLCMKCGEPPRERCCQGPRPQGVHLKVSGVRRFRLTECLVVRATDRFI